MSNFDPMAALNALNALATESSVSDEKVKIKYRAHIVQWLSKDDGELYPINLPFGIALELTDKIRKSQGDKTLALTDALLKIAKTIPEGEYLALTTPVSGQLGIILRHTGEKVVQVDNQQESALDALIKTFIK